MKDPMKSISFVCKTIPGMEWGLGVSWMGGLGVSLKWGVPCREGSVMEGWGGSWRGGVGHT